MLDSIFLYLSKYSSEPCNTVCIPRKSNVKVKSRCWLLVKHSYRCRWLFQAVGEDGRWWSIHSLQKEQLSQGAFSWLSPAFRLGLVKVSHLS